jgi:hypothetical protein
MASIVRLMDFNLLIGLKLLDRLLLKHKILTNQKVLYIFNLLILLQTLKQKQTNYL